MTVFHSVKKSEVVKIAKIVVNVTGYDACVARKLTQLWASQ